MKVYQILLQVFPAMQIFNAIAGEQFVPSQVNYLPGQSSQSSYQGNNENGLIRPSPPDPNPSASDSDAGKFHVVMHQYPLVIEKHPPVFTGTINSQNDYIIQQNVHANFANHVTKEESSQASATPNPIEQVYKQLITSSATPMPNEYIYTQLSPNPNPVENTFTRSLQSINPNEQQYKQQFTQESSPKSVYHASNNKKESYIKGIVHNENYMEKSQIVPAGAYEHGKYYVNEIPVTYVKSDGIPMQMRGTVDYGAINYGVLSYNTPPSVDSNYGHQQQQVHEASWNSVPFTAKEGLVKVKPYQPYLTPPPPKEQQQQQYNEAATNYGFSPMYDLDNLNIFEDTITLSGLSSGGGLAQQMLVSYSSLFSGIAVFQQTFYRCGRGNGIVSDFDNLCTNLGNQTNRQSYDPKLAINEIGYYFRHGLIEDPMNLQNKRLFVYAGLQNMIFKPEMMLNVIKVFEPFINNPYTIRTRVQDAASLLPTSNFGHPCNQDATNSYLLGSCNLNGPYEALSFLLGEEIIKLPRETDKVDMDSLVEFDQSEFFHGIDVQHFMSKTGYIYIPQKCGPMSQHSKCHLHIYFHGCGAGVDMTKGNHIRYSGFLELAELNNVVILFPQIESNDRNPLGCWDSYGYTGPLYATQNGAQVMIIRRMLSRILK